VHVVGDRAKQYLGDKFVQFCVSNGIEFTPRVFTSRQMAKLKAFGKLLKLLCTLLLTKEYLFAKL
jgi:hypothetical protein